MIITWQAKAKEQWFKWAQENPVWMPWIGFGAGLFFYYLAVVVSSDYLISQLRTNISNDQKQAQLLTKASREVLRLRASAPHAKPDLKQGIFAAVNATIDAKGWNNLVANVRQIDAEHVQVNFKSIDFNELMGWLQSLYNLNGIYVAEASLKKTESGAITANLVLQQDKK